MPRIRILLAAFLIATPLAAQTTSVDAEAPDMTDASDIGILSCAEGEEGASCEIDTDRAFTFCMAVDEAGEPLANSMGATDAGVVLFQNVDPEAIASLRCRDV